MTAPRGGVLGRAGLADPVFDAQALFRGVMQAMARPGSCRRVPVAAEAPPPLQPAVAALALALLDADTALWLDPPLAAVAEVGAWLRFHTGTRVVVQPAAAGFALIADPAGLPPLDGFAQGNADYPDRSATLLLQLDGLTGGLPLVLTGPGLAAPAQLAPWPLPPDFVARMAANRAGFPLGVDLILAAGDRVAALPRSTAVAAPVPASERG
ncbi:MAG: phosphonate C-P lyase system protein PhnH [Sneathiellaceae bacterium]